MIVAVEKETPEEKSTFAAVLPEFALPLMW